MDIHSVNKHLSGIGLVDTVKNTQQGGFAGSRGSHDADEPA